jgi:hypothetical protein
LDCIKNPNWDIGWIETPSKYGLSGLGQPDLCPNPDWDKIQIGT